MYDRGNGYDDVNGRNRNDNVMDFNWDGER